MESGKIHLRSDMGVGNVIASLHITNSFGFLVGSYRRRQGQKEGKEAGSRKIKEIWEHGKGNGKAQVV